MSLSNSNFDDQHLKESRIVPGKKRPKRTAERFAEISKDYLTISPRTLSAFSRELIQSFRMSKNRTIAQNLGVQRHWIRQDEKTVAQHEKSEPGSRSAPGTGQSL